LHDRLGVLGAELLLETLPEYCAAKVEIFPQPVEGASYAVKISKEHGRIEWSRGARQIYNQIRAFDPWPGSFATFPLVGGGGTVKIWKAMVESETAMAPMGTIIKVDKHGIQVACGEGILKILTLQKEGGKRLSAEQFLAGHKLQPGQSLASGTG
jgi:methionyl-tRNA formyltransferase